MDKVKNFFILIGTAVSSWFGYIAIPIVFLLGCNIVDYATGYTAAPYRGEKRKSDIGFRGIAKKLCMLILVIMGGVVDWLIMYSATTIGLQSPFKYVISSLVTVWLICNEIISILENIGDIGVALPPFLMKAVKWVKAGAEKQGELKNEKDLPIT